MQIRIDCVLILVSVFLWSGSSNENVLLAVKCLDRMMRKRRQVGCLLVFANCLLVQLVLGECIGFPIVSIVYI